MDSIKDVVRSFVKVSEFDKHLKMAGTLWNNYKAEDNSPKIHNDKKRINLVFLVVLVSFIPSLIFLLFFTGKRRQQANVIKKRKKFSNSQQNQQFTTTTNNKPLLKMITLFFPI